MITARGKSHSRGVGVMSNVSNKIEAAFVKGEIESLEFALSLCKKQTELRDL